MDLHSGEKVRPDFALLLERGSGNATAGHQFVPAALVCFYQEAGERNCPERAFLNLYWMIQSSKCSPNETGCKHLDGDNVKTSKHLRSYKDRLSSLAWLSSTFLCASLLRRSRSMGWQVGYLC